MKSERRHDLETNTLATELATWGERVRPYASSIVMAVAVAAGLFALLSLWNTYASTREQKAWLAYERAIMQGDVDYRGVQLVASSDEFAGSRMQEWAYMAWADRQLRRASEMYLIDRDASLERLTAIVAFYEQFAESSTDSDIRNRARLGLARVAEMRGQLDEAKKQYALVQGALAAVAEARLDELQGGGVEDSTKWLATAELPKPPAPSGAGAPGRRPDFGVDLPSSGEAAGPLGEVQSMEEILGGLLGGSSDDGARYDAAGAGESAADSEPDADAPATDDEAAAAEAADAEDAATPAEQ